MMEKRMKTITSPQNETYKRWKKLLTRKGRESFAALLVEGEHLALEALRAGLTIRSWIVREGSDESRWEKLWSSAEGKVYRLPPQLFAQLVETESPQGIVVEVSKPGWEEDQLLFHEDKSLTFLLIDAIQDPGNLGTILRTAQAAGVDGVYIGKGTVDPFQGKVLRSSMGAVFHLPLFFVNLEETMPAFKQKGVTIFGTSPHAGTFHFEVSYPRKVAFLLGNEGRGVAPRLQEMVDASVMIPMPGKTESLNVSVTAGVLLYERIRQEYMTKK
jgi:RNA methyltransferase, TrmH family